MSDGTVYANISYTKLILAKTLYINFTIIFSHTHITVWSRPSVQTLTRVTGRLVDARRSVLARAVTAGDVCCKRIIHRPMTSLSLRFDLTINTPPDLRVPLTVMCSFISESCETVNEKLLINKVIYPLTRFCIEAVVVLHKRKLYVTDI